MKKVKRIIAVVLLILVLAIVGYTQKTCSRTADIIEDEQTVEEEIEGGNDIEEDNSN